jgi:hypothetical protein
MSWRHAAAADAERGPENRVSKFRDPAAQTLSSRDTAKKTTSPADGTVFQWQIGIPVGRESARMAGTWIGWGVTWRIRRGRRIGTCDRNAVRELFARVPRGPVVMLNLIRLREVADYAATPDRRGRRFTAAPTRRTYFERRARPVINPESRWGCQDLFCRLSGRRDAWGCVEASSRASLAWPSLRIPMRHLPRAAGRGSRMLGIVGIRLFSSGSRVSDSTFA